MTLRFARHTDQLEDLIRFYSQVLNFEILGDFRNHDDYDGVFLGLPNTDWHIEFTTSKEKTSHTFDDDDILVFYPKSMSHYEALQANLKD